MASGIRNIKPIHHVNGAVVTLGTPVYCEGSVALSKKLTTTQALTLLHDGQTTLIGVVPALVELPPRPE